MAMFDALAPSLSTIAGSAVMQQGNSDAANTAGTAAVQSAQIQTDALTVAQQQARYYADLAKQYLAAGNLVAAQQMQAYADHATQTVKDANAQSIKTNQSTADAAAPGTSYLRSVVAGDGSLTPAQQKALADARLSDANMIHSSNFAGSGRSAAALLKQNETDLTNSSLEANRQRALTAAGTLNGQQFQANTNIANTQQNQGQQISNIDQTTGKIVSGYTSNTGTGSADIENQLGANTANMTTKMGQVTGAAVDKAGLYNAQAGLANAQVTGKAIGDIGSQVASATRLGRYADSSGSAPTTKNADNSYGDYSSGT